MEQIEYTRTVVPSSMRSPYWKYFGFPSDNANNILTRQKIVCTICNTAIAYNKNTSNLRTHLMSKHVEIFQRIITTPTSGTREQLDEKLFNQTATTTITGESYVPGNQDVASFKRLCLESHKDTEESPLEWGANSISESFLIVPETTNNNLEERNENAQVQNCNYLSFVDNVDGPDLVEVVEASDEEISENNAGNNVNGLSTKTSDTPEKKVTESIEVMLADMVQTDLLTLDALTREGFCKYNKQLTGISIDGDTIERIMEIIEERFTKTQQMINALVAQLSHIEPFSLSIEIYEDNGHDNVLNIYFNYLNINKTELVSILYKTCTITNYTSPNISDLLSDINIKNCSGIVVPSLNNVQDFISTFAKCYDIPLVECFESMLTHCLHKIYESCQLSEDFDRIIQKERKFLYNKKIMPKYGCCWSKLEALEEIFKNLKEYELEQWQDLKNCVDYLKPLKMALDIVADELLPSCSLIRPMIIKLYEEHFLQTKYQPSKKILQIQKILQKDMYEKIIKQNFLKEATFFDPRFHRDFAFSDTMCDFKTIKSHIMKRFKTVLNLADLEQHEQITTKEISTSFTVKSEKPISLKTFFRREPYLQNSETVADVKSVLDVEFEQYHSKECLDLAESPALWWQQATNSYKQLSIIAKFYLTVPCCYMPRLYRLDVGQRRFIFDRRKRLNQLCQIESKLWYLFYNNWLATESM